jgi:hypothetical protein
MTQTGAIQEVPYAAHGDGFSFVLGLLDRHNRLSERSISNGDSDGTGIDLIAVDENSVVDVVSEDEVASDTVHTTSFVRPFPQLGVKRTQPTGSLLRMSTDEGVAMIRSCMDAARKRTLSCLGSYRIKGVSRAGCKDLGID